jgi:hypothetical protein
MKFWEVVFRKPLSDKQTHPKYGNKSQLVVLTMKTTLRRKRFEVEISTIKMTDL